jgi:hypothetical protein
MAKWMAGLAGAALLMTAGMAQAQAFSGLKPADVVTALKAAGATGDLDTDTQGNLFFKGVQDDLNFSVEFRDCAAGNATCASAYYLASWEMEAPALSTLNLWNDVTYVCAAFEGADGSPYLKMGFLPKATDTRAGLVEDHDMWMQCVGEFKNLLADPAAFEASISPPKK